MRRVVFASKARGFRLYSTQKKKNVMFIGCVWPEWRSTAAGVRTKSLVEVFLESNRWNVSYSSTGRPTSFKDELEQMGIKTYKMMPIKIWVIGPDRSQLTISDIRQIYKRRPYIFVEEYSWQIRELVPNAAIVIDTQDLHSLRHARESLLLQGRSISEIKNHIPASDNLLTLREVAAILRSDHSLLVSPHELSILKQYGVSENKLSLAPFYYNYVDKTTFLPYKKRKDVFFTIGNFRHKPNQDQFKWLRDEIWPKIHQQLPHAKLHIYGAYPDEESCLCTNRETNFIVKGKIEDAYVPLSKARVNLAPLRYGAGIKGKISDGWTVGTPVVSTSIGEEGMTLDGSPWGGLVGNTTEEIVDHAVNLFTNEDLWTKAQEAGTNLVNTLFNKEKNGQEFLNKMEEVVENLPAIRKKNIMGEVLGWYTQRINKLKFDSRKSEIE